MVILNNVSEVINAVGYATRIGGSSPHENVLLSMYDASKVYMEMDELQQFASEMISQKTGAEAGIVTCGSAAGLALAAAACMSKYDIEIMEQLPDTKNVLRNEMLYPRGSQFGYDHTIRLAGAKMVFVEANDQNLLEAMEGAITKETGAIIYVWKSIDQIPSVSEMAKLSQRYNIPLIVDGAISLPPTSNLKEIIRQGADLVTYSGGKHLGGPQASGILCGKKDLIMSAWLQMADMDVRPRTWSLRHLIQEGKVKAPPRHGIGRTMKVGKEAIVGLLSALERYESRNHTEELKEWKSHVDMIYKGLNEVPELLLKKVPHSKGDRYPYILIQVRGNATFELADLIIKLKQPPKKIILSEDEHEFDKAVIYPMCLKKDQVPVLIEKFQWAIGELRN